MVWLPIPPTVRDALGGVFSGGMAMIFWRLVVLVVGVVVLGLLLTSGSYVLASVAGIVVFVAASGTVRGILQDIWNARGTQL